MDFTELQFAAQVLDLAKSIRDEARHSYYRCLDQSIAAEVAEGVMKEWDEDHSIATYVPDALREIKSTASLIKFLTDEV